MANLTLGGQSTVNGRVKTASLTVIPLESSRKTFTIERFNSYSFSTNILIPVDTFSFSFRPNVPQQGTSGSYYSEIIKEGDLVRLSIGNNSLATGYVDSVDIEADVDSGVRLTINGRDLMGFLEDNDSVNPESGILYTQNATFESTMRVLIENTRINGFERRNIDGEISSLFATLPGESRLASLQRFIDPANAVAWMDPNGRLIIGRPDFQSPSKGTYGIRQFGNNRTANVLGMRVVRSSSQIPGAILPIYSGTEGVQTLMGKLLMLNSAEGPSRLFKAGHKIYRTMVNSPPSANDPQSLSGLQRLLNTGSLANAMQSLAALEFARANVNELKITCSVKGHLGDDDKPIVPDTCYDIVWDAMPLSKKMYLYGVDYVLSEDAGQVTNLQFCNVNTIVAGGKTS